MKITPKNAPEQFMGYLKEKAGDRWREVLAKSMLASGFISQDNPRERAIVALAVMVKHLGMDARMKHYLYERKAVEALVEAERSNTEAQLRRMGHKAALALLYSESAPPVKHREVKRYESMFLERIKVLYPEMIEISPL